VISDSLTAASSGTWQLGSLTVNRIGYGAMRLPGPVAFDPDSNRDPQQAVAVVRRAVELGVNHIDTAAFYFSSLRSANELLNRALRPWPDDLVLATKVGPARDASGEWLPWARPEQLRGQVEENLRQLGREHLDLVNLRTFGRGPIGDHVAALVELQRAGLVREIGVSNVGPELLDEARAVTRVVAVQNRFSVDSRPPGSDEVLRTCQAEDIAFVPFFAVAGDGRERGASGTEPASVLEAARAHGATPAQVRLAWTLHQGPHVLAIPGTGDLRHLEENIAAGDLRLSDEELVQLGENVF